MASLQAALSQAALVLAPELQSEAELLLAHLLQTDKSYILAHPETELTNEQLRHLLQLCQRRANGEPLAYITGYQEFYGRRFKVSPSVLIPRPDSETLIEQALNVLRRAPSTEHPVPSTLDIGTGSGCLIITLAMETSNTYSYTACDISAAALKIAKENATNLGADINFIQSNLTHNLPPNTYNLITANLPYLTAEQMSEASIQSEPELALYGGHDGLHYYRQLLQQLPKFTSTGSVILLEIDPDQATPLQQEIAAHGWQSTVIQDLSGRDRVIKIVI